MRKTRSLTDALVDVPGNLRLKATGTNGEIRAQFDPVDRARVYEAQYAQDANNGPWTSASTFGSTRDVTVPGLTRGKDYWVRVRAISANGPGGWSDQATIMVT